MKNTIKHLIICNSCRSENVEQHKDKFECSSCLNVVRIQNDTPRYAKIEKKSYIF